MRRICFLQTGKPGLRIANPSPEFRAMYEQEDEALLAYIAQHFPDATNLEIVEESAIPSSRRLRGAWEIQGSSVVENDSIARDIVETRLEFLKRRALSRLSRRALLGENVSARMDQIRAFNTRQFVAGKSAAQLKEDDNFTPPGLRE